MKRLFLNNQRIDTITQLRHIFAEKQNHEEIFKELWDKMLSSTLSSWLKRQDNKLLASHNFDALKHYPYDSNVTKETYITYLCELCEIELSRQFTETILGQRNLSSADKFKSERIKLMKWYKSNIFDDDIDWDMVVTSQEELVSAIAKIQKQYFNAIKGNSGCNEIYKIYLCNMGAEYKIDFNLSNIRFIGCSDKYDKVNLLIQCFRNSELEPHKHKVGFTSINLDTTSKSTFKLPESAKSKVFIDCTFGANIR